MASCAACSATTPRYAIQCSECGKDPALISSKRERYLLLRVIGRGPGRTTWRAERARDGMQVVIKEAELPKRADHKVRELVEREAGVLAALDHPQIPAFVEHWIADEKVSWLVLEHADGTDLEKWLAVKRFDEREVVEILQDLCEILGWLHARTPPVLHRDIKPANVVRRVDGRLLLVDFGAVREGLTHGRMTTVVGTVGYMAPEQFDGLATERSDIYGLGALAVGLLTGREMMSMMGHERTLRWQEHVEISPPLRALLTEMLAADPARRPEGIEEVRERLLQIASPRRVSAGAVLLASAALLWAFALLVLSAGGLSLFAAVAAIAAR